MSFTSATTAAYNFGFTSWDTKYKEYLKEGKGAKEAYSLAQADLQTERATRINTLISEGKLSAEAGKLTTSATLAKEGIKADCTAIKTAANAAKAEGGIAKAAIAGAKGTGSAVMKRMPVIGNVMTVGMEVPALISAAKNGDLPQQVGRSALNVTGTVGGFSGGMMAGAAIGTAICPVVGTVAGLVVGAIGGAVGSKVAGWIGNKLFGKSKADEKKEAEEAQQQAVLQQQLLMQQAQAQQSVGSQFTLAA